MEQTVQSSNTLALLVLLRENNMEDRAKELQDLLEYVSGMEQQSNQILEELRQVKEQLSELRDKKNPAARALSDTVHKMEARVSRVREQLRDIRQAIEDTARRMVAGFKRAGVSALRRTVAFFGIRKLLDGVQDIRITLATPRGAHSGLWSGWRPWVMSCAPRAATSTMRAAPLWGMNGLK